MLQSRRYFDFVAVISFFVSCLSVRRHRCLHHPNCFDRIARMPPPLPPWNAICILLFADGENILLIPIKQWNFDSQDGHFAMFNGTHTDLGRAEKCPMQMNETSYHARA